MKNVLFAVLLAGVIAVDFFLVFDRPSTPTASAGSADTSTLAAETLNLAPIGCWVPGDLIGEADPASIRCGS